jgi:outer membrane immunogenic protein
MNRFATAIAAIALIGTPAFAADMAVKSSPAPAPVYSWTGFYVGGNVGGAWSHDNATLSFPDQLSQLDPVTVNTGSAAVIGGVQEGFNWQFAPTWVWGLEADWSFTDAGRTVSQVLTVAGRPIDGTNSSLSTKLDWLGSARNRLGYLITPSLMLYGTGGVAWGKIDYDGAVAINTPSTIYSANTAFSHTAVGWTAGAGLEG